MCQIHHIESNVSQLKKELLQHEQECEKFTSEKEQYDADTKSSKKLYAKANKEVLLMEKNIKTKTGEQNKLKPGIIAVNEKIRFSQGKIGTAETSLADVKQNIVRQQKEVERLEDQLETVNFGMQEHQAVASQEDNGIDLGQDQMKEYMKLQAKVDSETFNEKETLKSTTRNLAVIKENILRLETTLEGHQAHKKSLVDQIVQLNLRGARIGEALENSSTSLKQIQSKRHTIDLERKRLHQKEIETNEKLEHVMTQLMHAKTDRQESHRSKAFLATLENLTRLFPGIHGRLLDLVKPTHRKYDLAVSIILGKNMDAIVVDTEKTAHECISYMRDQRCGSATFLPLDSILTRPVNEKYRTLIKGARLAIDAVTYESVCERALLYALGNAMVSDSIEIARRICYELREEIKVVALDGTLIHKSGMITGGHSESSNARRWEERELEVLQRRRTELVDEISEMQRLKRKMSQDEALVSQLSELEAKHNEIRDDIDANTQKIASIELELQHMEPTIANLSTDILKAKEPLFALQQQINDAESVVHASQNTIFAEFCNEIGVNDIREYQQGKLSATQEHAQKLLEYTTTKARLDNELVFEQVRLTETQKRHDVLKDKIQTMKGSFVEATVEKSEIDDAFEVYEEQISEMTELLDAAKVKLQAQANVLLEIKKQQQQFLGSFDSISRSISRKESEIETFAAQKLAILRKCKLEEIKIPLKCERSLDAIPLDVLEVWFALY